MYRILILVVVMPLVIWLFIKLIRSPKYDKIDVNKTAVTRKIVRPINK